MSWWENVFTSYGNSIKKGYKSNAYAPLVWAAFFFIVILGILSCLINDKIIKYALVFAIIFVIIFCLIMYAVILKKNPDLLQNERYRIEDKKIDLFAQQGDDGKKLLLKADFFKTAQIQGKDTDE